MDISIIIFIILLILVAVVIVIFLSKKIADLKQEVCKPKDEQSIMMLQQQLGQLSQTLDNKLSQANKLTQNQAQESTKFMSAVSKESRETLENVTRESREILAKVTDQFNEMNKHSQESTKQVVHKLTQLDETNKQVVGFSEQLKSLQDILKNPKQRGVLGEYYLEETLKNVLPPNSYQMQYGFDNGEIVDAVVFVDKKVIPIDSKFSLENYERLLNCNDPEEREKIAKSFKEDLKKRIDETAKYVRPGEGTVDFAFMFIPSESIYYDLLVNKVGATTVSSRDLIEYAFKDKHVVIVSPTSFLAYLQTVLQGLRALEINENAKKIQKNVEKLGNHLKVYQDFHTKLGNSLNTVVNHYKRTTNEFKKVNKDVTKITDGETTMQIEEVVIEKIEKIS
jgi:DNA recombination protein RmuC